MNKNHMLLLTLALALAPTPISYQVISADQFTIEDFILDEDNSFPEDGKAIEMTPMSKRRKFDKVPLRGIVPAGTRDASDGVIEVARFIAERADGLTAIVEAVELEPEFNVYSPGAINLPYDITTLRVLIGLLRYFDHIAPSFRITPMKEHHKMVTQNHINSLLEHIQQVASNLNLTKGQLMDTLHAAQDLQFPWQIIEALERYTKKDLN